MKLKGTEMLRMGTQKQIGKTETERNRSRTETETETRNKKQKQIVKTEKKKIGET